MPKQRTTDNDYFYINTLKGEKLITKKELGILTGPTAETKKGKDGAVIKHITKESKSKAKRKLVVM